MFAWTVSTTATCMNVVACAHALRHRQYWHHCIGPRQRRFPACSQPPPVPPAERRGRRRRRFVNGVARLPAYPPTLLPLTLLPLTRYRSLTQVLLCSLCRPRGGTAALRQLLWRSTGCGGGGKRHRGRRRRKLRKRRRRPFARCLARCIPRPPQSRGHLPGPRAARVERRSASRSVVVRGFSFCPAQAQIERVVQLMLSPKQPGWRRRVERKVRMGW